MKYILTIVGILLAALAALFLVFKLVTPRAGAVQVAPGAAPPPAVPVVPKTDRTAQRIDAVGSLVGGLLGSGGVSSLGISF